MREGGTALTTGGPALLANGYRFFLLAALLLIYVLNFADRVVLGILAVPIKAEMHLTDAELGLLGGTAFALFYSLFGVPVALLADRFSRVRIISIALLTWSAFTALCGAAVGFTSMFLCRLGVGVGEAGGVAPSYALISDYFPPNQRARALGVFSFGIPIGGALGLLLGGIVAAEVNWRTAFLVLGFSGVLIAPIFILVAKEPQRGAYDVEQQSDAVPGLRHVLATLRRKPTFWFLSFGYAVANLASYGISFWLPSFLIRVHGLSLVGASEFYAAILLIGGVSGIWLGASQVDRRGSVRPKLYLYVPLAALLAGIPLFAAAMLAASLPLVFALLLLTTALANAGLGPILSAVQHLVPASMRATASAVSLFISNLIGLGAGALVLGLVSDAFGASAGGQSLRYALLTMPAFQLVGAALLFKASRHVERDWQQPLRGH